MSATSGGSAPTMLGWRRASVRRTCCESSTDVGGTSDADAPAGAGVAPECGRRAGAGPGPGAPVVRGRAAVVQARGFLRDPYPRLLRRQRRRLGRFPRPDREARLSAVAGDRLHLAAAVLSVAPA